MARHSFALFLLAATLISQFDNIKASPIEAAAAQDVGELGIDTWNITSASEFEDVKNGNYAPYFDEDFNGIIAIDTQRFLSNFQIKPEDIQIMASNAVNDLDKFERIVLTDIHKNVVMFSKEKNVAIINMNTPNGLGGIENRLSYLPYDIPFKYCAVTVDKFTVGDKLAMDKWPLNAKIILTHNNKPDEDEQNRLQAFQSSRPGLVTILSQDKARSINLFQIIVNQFETFFKN